MRVLCKFSDSSFMIPAPICDESLCGQSKVYRRTDRWSDGQTQATTIPLWPERQGVRMMSWFSHINLKALIIGNVHDSMWPKHMIRSFSLLLKSSKNDLITYRLIRVHIWEWNYSLRLTTIRGKLNAIIKAIGYFSIHVFDKWNTWQYYMNLHKYICL